ncbi:MAG: LacI family DNA-binding transcriptional regulator [Victivallales bacterium]|nr:LacI family DNA-binding transcriptional regulator [Victivallales bacterium]
MPSIETIAKESGASIATVSRVLRQKGEAKTDIQRRILKVAERLGRPGEQSGRHRQILFISFQNVLSTESQQITLPVIMEGMNSVLHPAGYSLLYSSIDLNNTPPPALLRREVDGVIFHGKLDRDFYNRYLADLPLVGLSHYDPSYECNWVTLDRGVEGYQIVSHLVGKGHRRIAFFTPECDYTEDQLIGYRKAMAHFGLEIDPSWEILYQRPTVNGILPLEYELQDYSALLAPVFRSKNPPTAIFCMDNFRVKCVEMSLEKLGLKVPRDVSLVGTSNSSQKDIAFYQGDIACSFDDSFSMNAEAAKLLLRVISAEENRIVKIMVRPTFKGGVTVAPPRK